MNFYKRIFRTNVCVKSRTPKEKRVLITGSSGQIGKSLSPDLMERYGQKNVIMSDILQDIKHNGIFEKLDVTDALQYKFLMEKYKVTHILHLAAVLSAAGEKNPYHTMKVNCEGIINALEMAKNYGAQIFIPSSIAVFGPDLPKENVDISVPLNPRTIYGATKVFMENVGNYYYHTYNVDFRSLRYPGVVAPYEYDSHGITDYASEIYISALKKKDYTICLASKTKLSMVYLRDIIEGTIKFIEADTSKLTSRVYNVQGLSFAPEDIVEAIKLRHPELKYKYQVDFRDAIANSVPYSVDTLKAKEDWGWNPVVKDVSILTDVMFNTIKLK